MKFIREKYRAWFPLSELGTVSAVSALAFGLALALHDFFFITIPPAAFLDVHTLVEVSIVIISILVFSAGWFTFQLSKNAHTLVIGTAFLGIAILYILHAANFPGMPGLVTPASENKSLQFWILAQVLYALVFLAGAFVSSERKPPLSRYALLALVLGISLAAFAGVTLYSPSMPALYIEGLGLTTLCRIAELAVGVVLAAAFVTYYARYVRTKEREIVFYLDALIANIFGALLFVFFYGTYTLFNVLDHLYIAAAFLFIFHAVYIRSVREPYEKLTASERALRRTVRTLQTLSGCNQALVYSESEDELLRRVCHTIVNVGGYRLVWIGYAEHDDGKTVRSVAEDGYGALGYTAPANITWADSERGRGPTGTAIRTGEIVVARDILNDPKFTPWRAAAQERGYASSVALPLRIDHEMIGALNVYAAEPDAFDAAEVSLLAELADDLSYGIKTQRTAAAKKASEERYRRLLDGLLEGCMIIDREWRYLYVNEVAAVHGHEKRENLIGKTILEKYPGVEKTEVFAHYRRAMEHREHQKFESSYTFPDGSVSWYQFSVEPVDEWIFVLSVDTTERKRMEGALRENEAMLEEAQRLAHIGSWSWNITADEISWSLEYRRIYNIGPNDPTPKYEDHLKAYSAESARMLDAAAHKTMQTGEPYELELEFIKPDIAGKWILARGAARRDAEGKIVGLYGTAQDITERKKALEQLRDLSELRSKFLTIIAHQLRTPLSSVLWNLETLLKGEFGKLGKAQEKFLRVTYESSEKLNSRLSDLLTAIDIEEGRVLARSEHVALDSVAAAVMRSARKKATLKKVSLSYEAPSRAMSELQGDGEKLKFVLEKLMENAIVYTDTKGSVAAKLFEKDGAVRFEVRDTGIGIPETDRHHIFERFFRASNASTMQPDAFGLALHIAKNFIGQHHGKIGFESSEGKGSLFWFEVPLRS